MSGLTTYQNSNRTISETVGYSIRQAGVQGYLTNAIIAAATTIEDLIDAVNAAVVTPGSESPAQRLSIAKALREGANLGDLSASRIQGASTVAELADLTWVTAADPNTAHLGPGFFG